MPYPRRDERRLDNRCSQTSRRIRAAQSGEGAECGPVATSSRFVGRVRRLDRDARYVEGPAEAVVPDVAAEEWEVRGSQEGVEDG